MIKEKLFQEWMNGSVLKTIWILIDMSNGRDGGKNYCWYFPTKKMAMEHMEWQKKSNGAELSGPFKYEKSE